MTVFNIKDIPPHLHQYFEPAPEIGLEQSPEDYVAAMVEVFREVRRVLRDDGVLWLNLGDSYTSGGRDSRAPDSKDSKGGRENDSRPPTPSGLKPKDLVGIPWMVAFALRADGWYLRSDIIWCLSGGAWVYARTQKGEMPVMVKDLVRLNPSSVQLWNGTKWTRVLGWNQSADTTEKFELVLRSGERIGCTGGHLWPTQRGNVAARDLRVGDVIATCTLPEPDGAAPPGYLTLDAAWLTGLYLAEGSRSDDMAQLALHADETKWLPRIEYVARHFGGSMTYTVSGNKLSVRLYGRVLMAHFENYVGGHTAHDKHLTNACWRLPNEHLKELAHGYLNGDGHYDPKNPRVRLGFTRNYSLERDLRTLAARLGATLSLRPTVATCTTGKFPAFRGEWRWSRSGHGNERDMGEVTEIRASRARKFWDIGVEDEPHLFALASGVLTHNSKGNPMPESVTDRPTRSHEYIFLLTKSREYFYDHVAVKEPVADATRKDMRIGRDAVRDYTGAGKSFGVGTSDSRRMATNCVGGEGGLRNQRSVWTINPKPYKGAHFATMPTTLAEVCIKAGSSEKGCCPTCGAPWARVQETVQGAPGTRYRSMQPYDTSENYGTGGGNSGLGEFAKKVREGTHHKITAGWAPTCSCPEHEPVPCVVLDPFSGSGTTGYVANRLGRNYVGTDLNTDYLPLAESRLLGMDPPEDGEPVDDDTANIMDMFGGG
jgi:DNA modification methylase